MELFLWAIDQFISCLSPIEEFKAEVICSFWCCIDILFTIQIWIAKQQQQVDDPLLCVGGHEVGLQEPLGWAMGLQWIQIWCSLWSDPKVYIPEWLVTRWDSCKHAKSSEYV